MSDHYATVLAASKKIESYLTQLGAEGRGLHEKCSSLESQLPYDIVKQIRLVATIRNKLLHEDGYVLQNIKEFSSTAIAVTSYLETVLIPKPKRKGLTITIPDIPFHFDACATFTFDEGFFDEVPEFGTTTRTLKK